MNYIYAFLVALVLTAVATPLVIIIAERFQIIDYPNGRHQHPRPTPLLGGLAIFTGLLVTGIIFFPYLVATSLQWHHWLGVLIGASFLIIGGVLDDKYHLKPTQQFIWPVLASLAVVLGGVGIEKVTSPWGGFWQLDSLKIPILAYAGEMHYFMVVADCFTILWILGMIYTTKILDGLDGLVTGIASIASLIIFLFTQTSRYYQSDISLAAIIVAGAGLGFLIFNWNPAKVFLGESGSMLLGFILGVLSIISGGKIAIALLIMGIPILDVAWTIVRRLSQHQNPFKTADRQHLHFKLLDQGLGVKKTVLLFYFLATSFGLSALVLQSKGKLFALLILMALMGLTIIGFYWLDKKRQVS